MFTREIGKTTRLIMVLTFSSIFFFSQPSSALDLDKKEKLTLDELITGANKEGKLVWYSSMTEDYVRPVLEKFRETYPFIKTDFIRAGGLTLSQRFYAEKAKKIENCDAIFSGAWEFFPDFERKGFTARHDNLPEWESLEELAHGPLRRYVAISFATYVLAWHRKAYKDEEIPDDLWEFTKPKWKNMTASGDPATGAYAVVWFSYASDIRPQDPRSKAKPSGLGLKWMRAMYENGLLLAGQAGNVSDTIVSGRRPIVVKHRDYDIHYAIKHGADLGWKYPIQGPTVQLENIAVNINAPHPYTARLFVNWLLSKEGQLFLINEVGYNTVRKDMKTSDYIKGRRPLAECWILDVAQITPEESRDFSLKVNNALRGK